MTYSPSSNKVADMHGKILSLLNEGISASAVPASDAPVPSSFETEMSSRADKGNKRSMRLGDILIRMGKLTPEQVEKVRKLQDQKDVNFGRAAITLGYLKEKDIQNAVSIQFGYFHSEENKAIVPPQLVMINKPFSKEAENFRVLRTRLSQKENEAALRLLSVTSAGNETISQPFVISNLAISLAQLNRRVLLIDGHLRKPSLHRVFNIDAQEGLSDVLSGRLALRDALKSSMVRHLTILPAGKSPYNPQELLGSDDFAALVMKAVDAYDTVLISSPGRKGIADGQYIWSLTKSVLVLACKDKSRISEVKEMTSTIRDCGAHVVGTVLSR